MGTRYGSLEITEDMRLQRRTWRVERLGWVGMLLLVNAALLGLFSIGPLSTRTVESADGAIRVHYDRFLRNGAGTTIRVELIAPFPLVDLPVRISRDLVARLKIEGVQPQPHAAESGPGGVTWHLRNAGANADVHVWAIPETIGPLNREISIGERRVPVSFFVYP